MTLVFGFRIILNYSNLGNPKLIQFEIYLGLVINISEKRYKLHLTSEQLDVLNMVFDTHDWLCDCDDFPNCGDFKIFKKLKSRAMKLVDRAIDSRVAGHIAHRKMKNKYIQEGANIQRGL